jgi:hypothetical protein
MCSLCERRMPHLRRLHVRSATLPCVICDASMCDLHRVQLTTLDARCSGGRPLPRCRAVVAGGRCRWQCTRGRGARTRASSTGVVGQAAGKLPYATTLWLLDAVARHATAASSDFLRSRSGGAPTGASTGSADNAPCGPGCPVRCVCAAAGCYALSHCQQRVRLPPATRSPAACAPNAAARRTPAWRPPNARQLRVRRLPRESEVVPSSYIQFDFEGGSEPRRVVSAEGRGEARASPPPKSSAAVCVSKFV